MMFPRSRTRIIVGAIFVILILGSGIGLIALRDNLQNILPGLDNPREITEISPQMATHVISFVDTVQPGGDSFEEYVRAMKQANAEGITFEQLLILDDVFQVSSGLEEKPVVTVYLPASGNNIQGIPVSRDRSEFEQNIQVYSSDQGLSDISEDYVITTITFRSMTTDDRYAKMVYLLEDVPNSIDQASEDRTALRTVIENPITEESLESIPSSALAWGGPIAIEEYMTDIERSEKLDEGYRRVLIEECFFDQRIQEYKIHEAAQSNQWDADAKKYKDQIQELAKIVSFIDQQYVERTSGPCLKLYEQAVQIQFSSRLSQDQLAEIQSILPIVYPKGYISDFDLDVPLTTNSQTYSEILEENRIRKQQLSPADYTYRDIDFIIGEFRSDHQIRLGSTDPFSVGNAKIFLRTEPGSNLSELQANYLENRRYNTLPAGSVETFSGSGESVFTDLDTEAAIDGIALYTTQLGEEYWCIESLVNGNQNNCEEFDLTQTEREKLTTLIRSIEITPVYPNARSGGDEESDSAILTYNFWWF